MIAALWTGRMSKRRLVADGIGTTVLALACLGMAVYGLYTGELYTLASPAYLATSSAAPTVAFAASPRAFWVWIGVYLLLSVFLAYRGIFELRASRKVSGEWLN